MGKKFFIALMIISVFFISACDIYDTLYVKEGDEAVEVPEGDIIMEGVDIEEEIDTGEKLEEWEDIDVEEEVEELEDIDTVEIIDTEEDADEEGTEEIEIGIEEEEEKEIPEDAPVIIVEETELVSLVPKAEDPDKDLLIFTFTSPIDDNGEWQTNYGDAGEYTATITASDGSLTTSKEILIIVNRKEEAPVIDSLKPQEKAIEIGETDTIVFEVGVSDLNDDVLRYSWKLDGENMGDESSYAYETTYEDSGSHTIKVSISDGIFDTENIWSVTVNNLNRAPILEEVEDIVASENERIVIELEAIDDDGDELSYEISDERFSQDGYSFTWETTYDDAGEHTATVIVSDGVDTVSQEVKVVVENVNRAPVILDIIQK